MRDVKITRLRHGGGNGGQNKNKVETAVRIEHLPTGIVVTACRGRTQQANMREAMLRLRGRLAAMRDAKRASERRARRDAAPDASFGAEGRVRTYNFTRNSAVDHRTGVRLDADRVMRGEIDEFIMAMHRRLTE